LDAAEIIALRFSLGLFDNVHWIERYRLIVHILETPHESAIERWEKIKKIGDLEDRRWAILKALYDSFKEFCLAEKFDEQEFLKAYAEPTLYYLKDAELLLEWHSKLQAIIKEKGSEEAKGELKDFEKNYEKDKKHFDNFFHDYWGKFRKPQTLTI
jgi:hypothetical protein